MQRFLSTILIVLMIGGIAAVFTPTTMFAQAATNTIVSTELINFYGMTTSEVQQINTIFDNQGLPLIIVRLNAMNEFQSGTSSGITKAKQVIQDANARGIQVALDLHTWYTTWDNYFRDSAANSANNRNQYITYVRNVLSAFSGSNVYAFMVLNEPQARTASNSENQFILSIISAAKEVTSKPVSVRFMCGYSPSTGSYSSQIDQASDFLCRNTYWDPRSPSTSVYGSNEAKVTGAITAAHNQGKQLWITEFGKTKSNTETQRAYVEAFVTWAKSKSVDAVFCWVSQPEGGSGETYNIFNNYSPSPAFYELGNSGVTLPSPTPTPTTSPTPTPAPTTSPTPTLTPTPSTSLTPTPTPTPTTNPTSNVILEDNFENANTNKWTGTTLTSGETATTTSSNAYLGTYNAQFSIGGSTRSTEQAYIYKTISESEVYARGYFKIDGLPFSDNNDRFYLLELYAGYNALAGAGVRRVNGVDSWSLYGRDGSGWAGPVNSNTPTIVENRWYCVELHWKQSSSGGIVELYIDGVKIAQEESIDTSHYGAATKAVFGISYGYRIQGGLTVYGDEFVLSKTKAGM